MMSAYERPTITLASVSNRTTSRLALQRLHVKRYAPTSQARKTRSVPVIHVGAKTRTLIAPIAPTPYPTMRARHGVWMKGRSLLMTGS